MPRSRQIDPFLLVVVDHDQKIFSVEGPMTDDTRWNSAVVSAQQSGRQVNCHTPGTKNREQAAAKYAAQFQYQQVATGSIVRPGFDDHPNPPSMKREKP